MKAKEYLNFESTPKCATTEQWLEWKLLARKIIPAYGFCTDCLPEYQAKMILQKKCKFPEVKFRVVYDETEEELSKKHPNTKIHKIDRKGAVEGYLYKEDIS